jgi:hypothetical protein
MDHISEEMKGYLDSICKQLGYADTLAEFRRLYNRETGYRIRPTRDEYKKIVRSILHNPLVKRKYMIIEDVIVIMSAIHFGVHCCICEGDPEHISNVYVKASENGPRGRDKVDTTAMWLAFSQAYTAELPIDRLTSGILHYRGYFGAQ